MLKYVFQINIRIKLMDSYVFQKWCSKRNAVVEEIWARQEKRYSIIITRMQGAHVIKIIELSFSC